MGESSVLDPEVTPKGYFYSEDPSGERRVLSAEEYRKRRGPKGVLIHHSDGRLSTIAQGPGGVEIAGELFLNDPENHRELSVMDTARALTAFKEAAEREAQEHPETTVSLVEDARGRVKGLEAATPFTEAPRAAL